jgi:hypothetical protein
LSDRFRDSPVTVVAHYLSPIRTLNPLNWPTVAYRGTYGGFAMILPSANFGMCFASHSRRMESVSSFVNEIVSVCVDIYQFTEYEEDGSVR